MKKYFFLLLAIIGAIIPYAILLSWIADNGFNLALLFESIFANKISVFGWADVVISAIVLIYFIISDTLPIPFNKKILAVLATFTIGVSCGLPLYLYFREQFKPI